MDRPMRRALARMISNTGVEDETASAIARFESWDGSLENWRRRMWQTLSDYGRGRKHDADWTLIVLRVVVFHGGEDLVTPLVAETVYRARREAEDRQAG